MGTRTLVLSGIGFSRETERTVYIPDPHPTEATTEYEQRVAAYLNQQYGTGCWKLPQHTRESTLMRMDLQKATHTRGASDQLRRLQQRAKQSLLPIEKRPRSR